VNRRNFLASAYGAICSLILGKTVAPHVDNRDQCDELSAIAYCSDDDSLFVAGDHHDRPCILVSDDFGETFYTVNSPPHDGKINSLAVIDPEWWYVAYEDGTLWHTKNAGDDWEEILYSVAGSRW
jgi:photosystem II stability/assembly factor-like uncharacterized protein